MNYEAKSKKNNQPLKTSIWWATAGGNKALNETEIISSLFIISVLVLSLQWIFRSDMKDYAREYHTKVESEWKVTNKLAENEEKSSTYYLYLKNSKYNWVREVDAQTYLTHDIGSTIKIKYDKSDLLGESDISWGVGLIILLTIFSIITYLAATIFMVGSSLLIGLADLEDFWYRVRNNNNRDLSNDDYCKVRNIYNKYVKILKIVNTFIIVYFICFTAFMVRQFILYMGC